ncbi:MAG: hypothetical protein HC772_06060 [Leptolyngbyaceae cyanobacterium CRU_2_3]|nr:hypothetical protein [Leptolyngbyaceae cyanobacterium CRU_2_3]
MNDTYLSDFYHGWLIEITSTESGFEGTCYSPCRKKVQDYATHKSDFEAMQAAKQAIDWYMACQSLSSFLREQYESDRLSFEEWQSLDQSLANSPKAI